MLAAKQRKARWGILKGSSKESQASFPNAAADCMNQEQRSQRGNHVGAETSEWWERNVGERTNWDPIASGEMLFCWCREWGKHRPIYWGKIVLWWRKKKRPKSRPGPFFTVQSNLSSWRRWLKTNIVLLSAPLTEHILLVKELSPLTHPPQTQRRGGWNRERIFKTAKVRCDMMNIQGNDDLWYFPGGVSRRKIIKGQTGTFSEDPRATLLRGSISVIKKLLKTQ